MLNIEDFLNEYGLNEPIEQSDAESFNDGIADIVFKLTQDDGETGNTAVNYLFSLADNGSKKACWIIIKMFDLGDDRITEQDAEKYCTLLAFSGFQLAKDRLKLSFKRSQEELDLMKNIKSGDAHSAYLLYTYYVEKGENDKAIKYYNMAIRNGDKDALLETYQTLNDKNSSCYNKDLAEYYLSLINND